MSSSLEAKYRPKNLPIYFQYRKFKWDQFFVGLFGALAVFGVLLKIWEDPFWGMISKEQGQALYKIFMPVGFLGESIVFIIMGFAKGDAFIEVFPNEQENTDDEEVEELHQMGGVVVKMELPDSLKELIEEKMARQLDDKLADLSNLLVEDVERTRGLLVDTNEINSRIQGVANSLAELSEKIEVAGRSIGEFGSINAGNITENASNVTNRLETAGNELKAFEDEMRKLSSRFRNFNSSSN